MVFNIQGGYKPNEKWEFSTRFTWAGGTPYTPFDEVASIEAGRGIFDSNLVNAERHPAYHTLNVRFDRRFHFTGSNLIVYLDIWNVYGRTNVTRIIWDETENEARPVAHFTNMVLPVLGIEYEF